MTKQRFSASAQSTAHNFQTLMTEIGATSLHLNQDIIEGSAQVVFDRDGRRYIVDGTKFDNAADNLRACYHTIRILWRALSELGTIKQDMASTEFDRIFGGFLATPDDTAMLLTDGATSWWDVLGVERDASKAAIANAFRALSKIHHPDVGGSPDDFRKLRKAYDQAMAQLKARKQ